MNINSEITNLVKDVPIAYILSDEGNEEIRIVGQNGIVIIVKARCRGDQAWGDHESELSVKIIDAFNQNLLYEK